MDADMENLSIVPAGTQVHESANDGERISSQGSRTFQGRVNCQNPRNCGWVRQSVVFLLSPGSDHDSTHAVEVLRKNQIEGSSVLGDRTYGSQEIREYIADLGPAAPSLPKATPSTPGRLMGESTRNDTRQNTSSRKSSGSVEPLPDTTNLMPLFSLLFISLPLPSGYF